MKATHNQLKIIGGSWRGRKIQLYAQNKALRPTPNRVRETLFNWLAEYIHGSRCLDLFAGSGILGFEALSRGAETVTAVESHPETAHIIHENAEHLDAFELKVVVSSVLDWLRVAPDYSKPLTIPIPIQQAYDIVFLDPPYELGVIKDCLQALHDGKWITPGGLVYVEHNKALNAEDLPSDWAMVKHQKAASVFFYLLKT